MIACKVRSMLFFALAIASAYGTYVGISPQPVHAAFINYSCESPWGNHNGECSCHCQAFAFGSLFKYVVRAEAYRSSSMTSTGYTNLLAPPPADPSGATFYDGSRTKTRVNCTDTDINFWQVDSSWSGVSKSAGLSSVSSCPSSAPIAYEWFCKIKGMCVGMI
jgi:hypothetical protein